MTSPEDADVRRTAGPHGIADAIVALAVRGFYQPGQRLKEQDLAEHFSVSRLPVREALTELASQGVLDSSPRRGMRLMQIDGFKLRKVLEVRERLETLALRTALPMFRTEPASMAPLDTAIEEMAEASDVNDRVGIAIADMAFHRALCVASGNEVLVKAWSAVSRQMLIIVGAEQQERPTNYPHVEIHKSLRKVLAESAIEDAEKALSDHILRHWVIARR
ncbi:MAG: GntR family transcriptional regulator [Parvibaculaceae bacterium]